MITMITLHMISKENREQALAFLKKNTEVAKKAKGLVLRQVFISQKDPLKGYSITSWKTQEDLEAFRKNPDRPRMVTEGKDASVYEVTPKGKVLLFTRTDTEIYDLASTTQE